MAVNWNCDGSGPHTIGMVKLLPTGGGANLILCQSCWHRELGWRRRQNLFLGEFAQFDLPSWDEAEVYGA